MSNRDELRVSNVFHLADGRSVIACTQMGEISSPIGKVYLLTDGREVRQRVTISAESKMLRREPAGKERALEVRERVRLQPEEALTGNWKLVSF
jgi:hypothetical protein